LGCNNFGIYQDAGQAISVVRKTLALLWHILLSSVIFRIPESAFD
jgi:hypothetical protein